MRPPKSKLISQSASGNAEAQRFDSASKVQRFCLQGDVDNPFDIDKMALPEAFENIPAWQLVHATEPNGKTCNRRLSSSINQQPTGEK